jgi:hypothetical protein
MGQFRVQLSPGWLVVAIVIIGVNLASVRMALRPKVDWLAGRAASIRLDYLHDGSVVKYIHHYSGGISGPIVVQPASAIGLWRVWWPVAASAGISLIILGVGRIRTRLRPVRALRRPRAKTIQVMVVIGLISFGLWLIRFDLSWIISGSLVLLLMLLAAYRRTFLAQEIKSDAMSATALSTVGIAGYSIAVLLALAWMISILFWDSYRHGSR